VAVIVRDAIAVGLAVAACLLWLRMGLWAAVEISELLPGQGKKGRS
jgi:hypothetical protein